MGVRPARIARMREKTNERNILRNARTSQSLSLPERMDERGHCREVKAPRTIQSMALLLGELRKRVNLVEFMIKDCLSVPVPGSFSAPAR